jgi:hypothetical protein
MKNKLEVPNHFESLMLSSKIKYWHQYSALWQRKRILQWKILCKTSWNGNQTRIKCTLLSSTKWHSRKRKPNYLGDGKNYDSRKSKQTNTLNLGRSYGVLHLHSKQNTSQQKKNYLHLKLGLGTNQTFHISEFLAPKLLFTYRMPNERNWNKNVSKAS